MMARSLIAVTAVALSFGAGAARAQLLSPGKLSTAHESIDGDDNCSECHSSGKQLDEGRCFKCHNDLGARIKASKGLHGRMYKGQKCGTCHVEHIGRKATLVRWPRGSKTRLKHAQTGWALGGKHARVACDRCHKNKNLRGNKTYLGLSTKCASCHEDPHSGTFGTCEGCHTENSWKQVSMDSFDHSLAKFPLRGKHSKVDCRECHGDPAKYRGIAFASCGDCHKDPHRGGFKQKCSRCHSETGWKRTSRFRRKHPGLKLIGGHKKTRCTKCHDRGNMKPPSKGRACAACHKPVHLAKFGKNCKSCHSQIIWTGLPESIGRDNHKRTRYPLVGKHRKTKCGDCHPKQRKLERRYRGLPFAKCRACHDDRHDGSLADRGGGECGACHTERGFWPTSFGVEQHAATKYALEGKHVAAPCGGCHVGERPRVRFSVPGKVCIDCHDNPHGEQFSDEVERGGCASCHTTRGWRQANIDHSVWPLTGAHAATACAGCHDPSNKDRFAAKGSTYRGVPRECAGCHDDTHAGQFRLNQPTRTCGDCHGTESFEIRPFAHDKQAGHLLEGKHQALKCAKCHAKTQLRNGATSVRYRLGYDACRDCHANPHTRDRRDTSLIEGMDCGACHGSTAWNLSSSATSGADGFDHARTGFPLTGAHEQTGCAECHAPGVRLGRECTSCHADEHKGRMSTQCDACHNASTWLETRASREHRLTRLPLTGMHAVLDCSSCHIRTTERQWTGVPADCFACHEQDYRRDAHPDHDGDPMDPSLATFSRVCGECHRATAWTPAIVGSDVFLRAARTAATQDQDHDAVFPISFGRHRGADCESCHVTSRAPEIVECTGCHAHGPVQLRIQHGAKLGGRDGAACLRCHPGGVAR